MNTRQNRLLADHFYLEEASYADFSQAKTGNTSEYDGDIAKDAMSKKKERRRSRTTKVLGRSGSW